MIVSDVIRNKLNDPRISPMCSVTRVELSGDLQIAKVFISVLGTDADCRKTLAALTDATGRIQRFLAGNLTTRHCPQLHIEYDESLKRAAETVRIIDEVMREVDSTQSPGVPADETLSHEDGTAA